MSFPMTKNILNNKFPPKQSNGLTSANMNTNFVSQVPGAPQISHQPQLFAPSHVSGGSSSSSKLHQYFSSSQYLSSQEQLSIFIQNFPIIDIESSHKSLNQILPLLIHQNELLGKKCQSQVMLIKQSFSKHQTITKQNKQIKQESQKITLQWKKVIKQKEQEIKQLSNECEQMTNQIKLNLDFVERQNQIIRNILKGDIRKCQTIINQRSSRLLFDDFKTYLEMRSKNEDLTQQFNAETNKNDKKTSNLIIENWSIVSLEEIEKLCKQTRKKNKYYSKVKSSVQNFCQRLLKICKILPVQIVTKQLDHECNQFLDVIGEMICIANGQVKKKSKIQRQISVKQSLDANGQRKRTNVQQKGANRDSLSHVYSDSSLLSRLSGQELYSNFRKQISPSTHNQYVQMQKMPPFEHLLSQHLNKANQQFSQTIISLKSKIQQLKSQLQTSRQYYESYLINQKLQLQKFKRDSQQQMTLKDQMIRHFEAELEKGFSLKEELQNKCKVLEGENSTMKDRQRPLQREIQQMKQEIQQNQNNIKQALQKKNITHEQLQQRLNKKQQELLNQMENYQNKLKLKQQHHQASLKQKQELIQQIQNQTTKLQTQIRTLKQTVQDKNVQITRITKRLVIIQQDQVSKLERQILQIQTEILETKRVNKQLLKSKQQLGKSHQELTHEMVLHTTYIKQLENKILQREQSIQALNKKLSSSQIQKKTFKNVKQNNERLSAQNQALSYQVKKFLEENANLKRLVKEMKKELQEVYHTINDLKSIEKDRERLVIQSQKSQRWKEQIMRDYDQMKYDILKVEAQNKNYLLEVKHYKNALRRIEMIN